MIKYTWRIFQRPDKEEIEGKRVILRLDFNVPLSKGRILDDTRVKAGIKAINDIMRLNPNQIVVLAHLGRPKGYDPELSLAPIVEFLNSSLNTKIELLSLEDAIAGFSSAKIVCVENIRFYKGEETNDPQFVEKLATLGDVFVNDAFSVMHRKHASTYGLSFKLPSFIGNNALEELKHLDFSRPSHPFVVVMGGKKLETKLGVIEALIEKVDKVILGGALAFTFLKAKGLQVGKSFVEDSFLERAKKLLSSGKILLPVDVICAHSLEEKHIYLRRVEEIKNNEIGFDIGPKTIKIFASALENSKQVFWNGAMGVFEEERFADGTRSLINILVRLKGKKIAGGGETIQAINRFSSLDLFDFVSLGGGASLRYIAEGTLPCLDPLKKKQ